MNSYHVTTINGAVYVVAATSWRSAMSFVADELRAEGSKDVPIHVRCVSPRWEGTSPGVVRLWAAPTGCAICAEGLRRWNERQGQPR